MTRFIPVFLLAGLALTTLPLEAQRNQQGGSKAPANYQDRPAIFEVTSNIVNADLEPFTITLPAFGNTVFIKDSNGFEPTVFRNRMYAAGDGENRIPIDERQLSNWDSWRSGYLDGADVRVYRVIDGKMALVREDKVKPGGAEISGWKMREDYLISPEVTQYQTSWPGYHRTDSDNYFAVLARDKAGNISEISDFIHVKTPPPEQRDGKTPDQDSRFRAPRNADDKTPPEAPRNVRGELREDGMYVVSWDPVDDENLAGYIIASSSVHPDEHRGYYLDLEGKAASEREKIKEGDMIIVSTKWLNFDRSLLSDRVAGSWNSVSDYYPDLLPKEFYPDAGGSTWRLVEHAEDTPVESPGETYMEVDLVDGDEKKFGAYVFGAKDGDWYTVPHEVPYKVDVWLKADRADRKPVQFRVSGSSVPRMDPIDFQPTTEWQRFTVEFPGKPQEKGSATRVDLVFDGPGKYSLDNFRVHRADVDFLDYEPRYYDRIKEGGMWLLRTHGPIKTRTDTYDMDVFLNEAGLPKGIAKGNSLPQMLRAIKKSGAQPWLQIEFHMSPEEWRAFVEYMAAPYDPAKDSPESKPWAHRRYSQGQQQPWIDEFEEIWFEISNETWNWLFAPWVFEGMPDAETGQKVDRGRAYGMMQEHIIDIMRSSPYWTSEVEEKFVFPLGGWTGSNYGREAVRGSTSSDYMTIAAYNGGWDEGEGPPQVNPASFFNVLSQTNQTAIPRARKHAEEKVGWAADGFDAGLGTYEAGPGYALNGLNNVRVTPEQADEQEAVMKSKLAGTATLDSFLARAYLDFDTQNFFTFSEGQTWSSHAKWYRGGQPYPSYRWLEAFNHLATGDMLEVITESVPTVDTAKFRRRQAIDGAPLAAVYATAQGDRIALFCISRKVPGYPAEAGDGYTPFGVRLPFDQVEKITLYKMTGSPTDHNIDAENVKLVSENIPVSSFKQEFAILPAQGGVPPAEAFLYIFEGTNFRPGKELSLSTVLEQPATFTD